MSHVVDEQTLYASMWNAQDDRITAVESTAAIGGTFYYVICSSTASDLLKSMAHEIATGTADDVIIQAALDTGLKVMLVGPEFWFAQAVKVVIGDHVVSLGNQTTKIWLTYDGPAFKAKTIGASNRDIRIGEFNIQATVAGTGVGIDFRGIWLSHIVTPKLTNLGLGILIGGNTTDGYGEGSGNTIEYPDCSSTTVGIRISGTTNGLSNGNPTGNDTKILYPHVNMNNIALGADAIGIDAVDADTLLVEGGDFENATNGNGIWLRPNCRGGTFNDQRFEFSAQTAGYYPYKIDAGAGLDATFRPRFFSLGCTKPHIFDANVLANRRWTNLGSRDYSTEYPDGFNESNQETFFQRGIQTRAGAGNKIFAGRRSTDTTDRFTGSVDGSLIWTDPTGGNANPYGITVRSSPSGTTGSPSHAILGLFDDTFFKLAKFTSGVPTANSTRQGAMGWVDGGGSVPDGLYFFQRTGASTYVAYNLLAPTIDTATSYDWTAIQHHKMAGGTKVLQFWRTNAGVLETAPRLVVDNNGKILWQDKDGSGEQAGFDMTSTGAPIVVTEVDESHFKRAKTASLPSANSTRRGVTLRQEGATLVADRWRIAMKKADDTYAWPDLVPLFVTATLTFGAAGANGATPATQTVTVTGAAVGDGVDLAPPSALSDGLTPFGYVSASNTVTIKLTNSTGSPITPTASQVWGVFVKKAF